MAAGDGSVRAGNIDVPVSRLDKVFFPADGVTKGDLIGYYRDLAPAALPFLRGRPLVMERYPDGIDGLRLVQKNPATTSRTGSPGRKCGSPAAR
jgi:bifunctional non-homologous end joining protein LigD